jgi:ArsR family transcriptional regulator
VNATQFQRVAKALADPRRFEILEAITGNDELSCGEIVEQFTVSQATISHHIKELVNAGLVKPRRQGQYCYYRLCPEVLADYIAQLQQLIAVSKPKQKSRDFI